MHEVSDPSTAPERSLPATVAAALVPDHPPVDVRSLAEHHNWQADALVAALADAVGENDVVVCEGVLERLAGFVATVEELVRLSRERQSTVLLTAPNHAVETATHVGSMWTEGAVAELRHLLPAEHRLLHVVPLRGAALIPSDDTEPSHLAAEVTLKGEVPTAFVLAFGPRADEVAPAMTIVTADLTAERAHARALAAELDVLRAAVAAPAS